jgi:hypothetical protein
VFVDGIPSAEGIEATFAGVIITRIEQKGDAKNVKQSSRSR